MSDWSPELTLRFLGGYFSEPGIWDPRDPRHKDRAEVGAAWARLEAAMEGRASVAELKRKRENLMSTYRKLHNKVRASRAAGGEEFRPDWFAYDLMAAHLDDVYCPRVQPFKTEETEDSRSEYELDESTPSEGEQKELEVVVHPELLLQSGGPPRGKRKRRRDEQTADETSAFLDLLEIKLKALSPGLRDVAMHQIDNVLYHLKMQQNVQNQAAGLLSLPPYQNDAKAQGNHKP